MAEVRILSKRMVQPSPLSNEQEAGRGASRPLVLHLTPWDLRMLSVDYIQKGILFRNQRACRDLAAADVVSNLLLSFSHALGHFFPLAGRLAEDKHDDGAALSVHLECNDEGAEFVHAAAPDVTVSDILDSTYIPSVVLSFFPLNGVLSYDARSLPPLAAQVTELADGFFVALSLNHAVADGTSFWHFFNTWSAICQSMRCGREAADVPVTAPVLKRWFLDSCPKPIPLPFGNEEEFIRRTSKRFVMECAFHFSAASVAKLKAKANDEMGMTRLSSLQSVLAHLWRSVTRARGLDPEQETTYSFLVGCRSRITPPLPEAYLGNSVYVAKAKAPAKDVLTKGLGWAAWQLNQAVAAYTEETVRAQLEEWPRSPTFIYVENTKPSDLITGSSPRFNIYGNDFGWGPPVAVRSGYGNKGDGKATVYPGPEKGSMALEVCLPANVLSALMEDEEFMEMVSKPEGH